MDAHAIAEPSGWEDALTGLEGPDLWRRVLVAESARSFRYGRDLTVVVAALDGLDAVVDTWGTDAARRVMHATAQCLRRMSRTSDYPTRISRVRFGVILTETDEVTAINYVERVREELPRSMPPGGDLVRTSFGWASLRHGESGEAVVGRAESRLLAELRAGA